MSIVLAGFVLGLSLIVAVGPQNAMLLKYGIRRDHIGLIIVVCALSDVILITSGTAGVGYLVERFPNALEALKYIGAAYLAFFTFTCFRDAFKTKGEAIDVESTSLIPPRKSRPSTATPRVGPAPGTVLSPQLPPPSARKLSALPPGLSHYLPRWR